MLELLGAGPRFEEVLQHWLPRLDEGLVEFIQRRIGTAKRLGETVAVRPMALLVARLKVRAFREGRAPHRAAG